MPYQEIEDTNIYQLAERIADAIWNTVMKWDVFPKDTVGTQIVRAADSIGANMAESSGRLHPADVVNFLYYSRGSLRQTMFFLRRAKARKLIDYHAYEE